MDLIIENLVTAFGMLLSWQILMYIPLGLMIGMTLGSIPGLSGVTAITLMLIPSYYMPSIVAIVFLTSIYTGSVYGGGITAVLMNVPGTPAAIATGFDGYPLTQQGKHSEALGLGLMASVIGFFISAVVIFILLFPIGKLVVKFGPPEILMVVVLAISSIGIVKGKFISTVMTGLFGIIIGTIGASPHGTPRGIFGLMSLYEGIPLIPALLGMLAVSELFFMVEKKMIVEKKEGPKQNMGKIIKGIKDTFKYWKTIIKSALIGTGIGLLPAAGSTIASMISYGFAKRNSDDPDKFGKGEPEGVVAAETANNASQGGALATMMTLGIPGSATTALLLAAFMIQGLTPGPFLIRDHLDFAYAVILALFPISIFLIITALVFVNYFSRLVFVPTFYIVPGIMLMAVLGSISFRSLQIDAIILIVFALLGYILKKLEYPLMGFILGFILGSLADTAFVRTMVLYSGEPLTVFKRPIFVVLFIITIMSFIYKPLKEKIFNNSN